MIFKVDGISTRQYYELIAWLMTDANRVCCGDADKAYIPGVYTVVEITRDMHRRHPKMVSDLHNVVRIVSTKGNLVAGNTRDERDSYDIVLEVPQRMWMHFKEGNCGLAPIPPRIMAGVMGILSQLPDRE